MDKSQLSWRLLGMSSLQCPFLSISLAVTISARNKSHVRLEKSTTTPPHPTTAISVFEQRAVNPGNHSEQSNTALCCGRYFGRSLYCSSLRSMSSRLRFSQANSCPLGRWMLGYGLCFGCGLSGEIIDSFILSTSSPRSFLSLYRS